MYIAESTEDGNDYTLTRERAIDHMKVSFDATKFLA